MARKSRQPAGRNFGITVEQHDVAITGRRHARVDRGDEALVDVVAEQRDRPFCCEATQPFGHTHLGRAVINDDDFRVQVVAMGQHARHATTRFLESTVDRDHNRHP